MTATDLAMEYMRIFFSGKNLDDLRLILKDNLRFDGPFHSSHSADDYINALKSSPPKDLSYKILQVYESKSSACLIYEFRKGATSTPMAQIFQTDGDKIEQITLIFDSRVLC